MANEIALFKGAGLPAGDLAKYKQNLQKTQLSAPTIGGLPILKLRKDGTWCYGQTDTDVQDGSEWAINPVTFKKGFIAWAKDGGTKPLGDVLAPVLAGDLPRLEDMVDVGAEWRENVYFELTCLNGDDEGKTVKFTNSAMGAVEAFHTLIAHLIHQIETDPSKLVPIVSLEHTSYQHSNRSYGIKGVIVKPLFEIVEWVSNGQAPDVGEEEPEGEDDQQEEAKQPERRAAPARGTAAPAREPAKPAAPPRGPVPARGSAIPRNAPKREAAPARGNGKPVADVSTETQPDVPPEDAGPVVRRRRRAVTDIPA